MNKQKTMQYFSAGISLFLVFIFSHVAYCSQSSDISLYKTLFYIQEPEYSPQKIDIQKYPDIPRGRLIEYQERAKHFRSKMKSSKGQWEQQMAFIKKTQVEQGIVALISKQGIEKIASQFAKNAPLSYEWEGFSDGPLDEAKFAEDYLKQNPSSSLKPYLLLFLIHRYRIAYECLDYEKNYPKQAEVSNKYHQYLRAAKNEKDPLVKLIADDMDKQNYLYIKTEKHP